MRTLKTIHSDIQDGETIEVNGKDLCVKLFGNDRSILKDYNGNNTHFEIHGTLKNGIMHAPINLVEIEGFSYNY